jgi:hypothetical protein
MMELNEQGVADPPLQFSMHITNTQVHPMHTWSSSTLDVEHSYREDEHGPLPFPADYVRTMTMARRMGCVSFAHFPLRNRRVKEWTEHKRLSDWGMHRVHEIRGGGRGKLAQKCQKALDAFGYGSEDVRVHSYWAEQPFVSVSDGRVRWLALTREEEPRGLLVLQSYAREPVAVAVRFPGGRAFRDVAGGETLEADEGGELRLELAADYGTRVLLAAENADLLPPAEEPEDE